MDKRCIDIVDERLTELIDMGSLPGVNEYTYYSKEFGMKMSNRMSQRYWDRFINLCDNEIIDIILSMEQPKNWNAWLYKACQKRRGIKI